MIMSGYGRLNVTEDQNLDVPLFAINNEYYNAEKTRVYNSLFDKDIGLTAFLGDNKYLGSYVFFEKDKIVDVKRNLMEEGK